MLGFYSIEIDGGGDVVGGDVVGGLHRLLKVSFKPFLEMARNVLRLETLHIEHGVVGGVVVVVEVDGDLTGILLPVPVGPVVLVLPHDLHLQLGSAFFFRVVRNTSIHHLPVTALDFVCLAQNPRCILIHFPVRRGFLFKVCQPFHTVTLCEKVHVYLALPIVQVREAEGLDEMRDRGEETTQVFIMVQIKDPSSSCYRHGSVGVDLLLLLHHPQLVLGLRAEKT